MSKKKKLILFLLAFMIPFGLRWLKKLQMKLIYIATVSIWIYLLLGRFRFGQRESIITGVASQMSWNWEWKAQRKRRRVYHDDFKRWFGCLKLNWPVYEASDWRTQTNLVAAAIEYWVEQAVSLAQAGSSSRKEEERKLRTVSLV